MTQKQIHSYIYNVIYCSQLSRYAQNPEWTKDLVEYIIDAINYISLKQKEGEVKLIGMWLFCDSIFSLRTYWDKEDWFAQGIRWVRLVCSLGVMIWG